ncbi:bifunctional chorismate-binding protein/class IV aminotransferase [Polynucleobacter sinensis]|uniref:bifunctional chorismate-binding protein/class IV aminotransferase n=1 Tax=Polynucleobacter sinensis TaxID=1743157 RepID=UPI0007854C7C|nr:bifunctional anthranilate synthase component I family protein/class IV aminotransferase [Polynucleobacter sinensis]
MILLDDAQSTAAQPTSRLYRQAIGAWSVYAKETEDRTVVAINECLEEIHAALACGQYVVAAFSYELGAYLHGLTQSNCFKPKDSSHPLIAAWSFDKYEPLSKDQVDLFLNEQLSSLGLQSRVSGVCDLDLSIDESQFSSDINKIQEYIRNGDCYQINHTFRITGKTYGDPTSLYVRLRDRQPGRFGALILEDDCQILSQSPELFIERHGNTLTAMPMKGTANALVETPDHLSTDIKNRAENVMIVDLLRNDLGRIALPGSVKVPHLFSVARHGDVLQMTSTVQAQAKPNTQLRDVLQAVFPCGSVTGAPKKRSLEIIHELEPVDRGYYCGALGWLDPSGDFAFSVPIRTVEIERNPVTQESSFTLGVGAGITIDSEAKQEWEECRIKAAFLSELPSTVGLFETALIQNGIPQHLELHLARLQKSAHSLNIPFSLAKARETINQGLHECSSNQEYRLRLDLDPSGNLYYKLALIDPLPKTVKIFWAHQILVNPSHGKVHSGNILLKHKINQRQAYDEAWKSAESLGGFDALFINEQNFVTEGGRTSVFIKPPDDDRWLTPPLSAGVLPGVMRSVILNDPKCNAHEANLTIDDVMNAKEIILSNALRGRIPAHF